MLRHASLFLLIVVIGIVAGASQPLESFQPPSTGAQPTGADCYSCVSCHRVTSTTSVKSCPYNQDPLKMKKCIKFAEKYPTPIGGKNVSWVIRGCVSERGSCADLKLAYLNNPAVDLEYCTECDGDKCNGGSRSLSDICFAVFAVIAVPLFGKLILS